MSADNLNPCGAQELKNFKSIQFLRNHWSGPADRAAYYWYLTFENYPEVHSLAAECQKEIAFPYYDLTPSGGLHLTIDRIAFDGDITPDQLAAIKYAATRACAEIAPFDITIGSLGGTRGAVGLSAYPAWPIRELHDALRAATLSVYPNAPVKTSEFHPHMAIAYSNSDNIPAAKVITAVERLNASAYVTVTITQGTLVLLERRQRSYEWQTISRIPLSG